jgi:hypothetical protein
MLPSFSSQNPNASVGRLTGAEIRRISRPAIPASYNSPPPMPTASLGRPTTNRQGPKLRRRTHFASVAAEPSPRHSSPFSNNTASILFPSGSSTNAAYP